MKVWFFGVWSTREAGHFLHDETGRALFRKTNDCPFDVWNEQFDGHYPPRDPRQGEADTELTRAKGCTILAMWDRTVDSRPGANAAFIAEGTGHTRAGMWDLAEKRFPNQTERMRAFRAWKEKQ